MILSRGYCLSNCYSVIPFHAWKIPHGDWFFLLGNRTAGQWGRDKNPIVSWASVLTLCGFMQEQKLVKLSYCGKTEIQLIILLYLFFYPLFLVLLYSGLLLQFFPDLSFVSQLFKALVIFLLWVYDSQVAQAIACFVRVYFGFVCS